MDYADTIRAMPRDTYERLRRALELGKWPDGQPLSEQQKTHTLQAVIAWGELHLPEAERVGYIDSSKKPRRVDDAAAEQPLRWRQSGESS